jgi:hypothetical protein
MYHGTLLIYRYRKNKDVKRKPRVQENEKSKKAGWEFEPSASLTLDNAGLYQRAKALTPTADFCFGRSTTPQLASQLLAVEGIILVDKGKGVNWLDAEEKNETRLCELGMSAGFIDVRLDDGARQGRSGAHAASTVIHLVSDASTRMT